MTLARLRDNAESEALADGFAINLALAEAWDAFGRLSDFPFVSRLPESSDQRRWQVAFLRDDVLSHAELGPRFRQRIRRLEPSYPLADWARDRPVAYRDASHPLRQSQVRLDHQLDGIVDAEHRQTSIRIAVIAKQREAVLKDLSRS